LSVDTGAALSGEKLLERISGSIRTTVGSGGDLALLLPMEVNRTRASSRFDGLEKQVATEMKLEEDTKHTARRVSELYAYRKLLLRRDIHDATPHFPHILVYFRTNGMPRLSRAEMRAAREVLERSVPQASISTSSASAPGTQSSSTSSSSSSSPPSL